MPSHLQHPAHSRHRGHRKSQGHRDYARSETSGSAGRLHPQPEDLDYHGDSERLQDVWVALRANIRQVLESVTLADIAGRRLPPAVQELVDRPEVWEPH